MAKQACASPWVRMAGVGNEERPSRLEVAAYRGLGVRLDDRWNDWVRRDLADPRWARRYRLASVALFAGLGSFLVLGARSILGEVRWVSFGGFLGAFLGQVLFAETKRDRLVRLHLGPPRNPFTAGLRFAERLVVSCSMLVFLLALAAAAAFAVRDDPQECQPLSSATASRIASTVRPGVAFGDGAALGAAPDSGEFVAREFSLLGGELRTGVWLVRGDGQVLPADAAANEATSPTVAFSAPVNDDVQALIAGVRRCLR
jgi:hypothetical protein